MHCGEETNISDPRSYEHYWDSSWNKAWKKFRPVQDLNSWPVRQQCSVLPTELTSQPGADQKIEYLKIALHIEEQGCRWGLLLRWFIFYLFFLTLQSGNKRKWIQRICIARITYCRIRQIVTFSKTQLVWWHDACRSSMDVTSPPPLTNPSYTPEDSSISQDAYRIFRK